MPCRFCTRSEWNGFHPNNCSHARVNPGNLGSNISPTTHFLKSSDTALSSKAATYFLLVTQTRMIPKDLLLFCSQFEEMAAQPLMQ